MPNEVSRKLSFADAINEATAEAMREDDSVILYGLGVNDPGRVFGTTQGVLEEFGPSRVFETPTAENAMMGIAVGAALGGLRPIVTHQRFDFFLLAMDQLVNSAAKWRYMFGGQFEVPLVIRLITGRGWGQGPTHSQSFHAWFANVPGLKVVIPSNPADAKVLLKSSIEDNNPVLFIENRWLHQTVNHVPLSVQTEILGSSRVVRTGEAVTLVASGFGVTEAIRAAVELDKIGLTCDIVDLRSLSPLDKETIIYSLSKTKKLVVIDYSHWSGSYAATVVNSVLSGGGSPAGPIVWETITLPDIPEPASHGVLEGFHPNAGHIFGRVAKMFGRSEAIPFNLIPASIDMPPQGQLGPF